MSLALLAGGAQAAFGIGKAIFGQSQRSAAAARAKKAAIKKHRATKRSLYAKHQRDLDRFKSDVQYTEQMWNAKFQQGMADIQFVNQHAADTYYLRQQQLNQQFQQLAFEDQDRAVRYAKSQGVAAAKAQMGATAGRFDVAAAAIKGRNEAIQAREVTGMIDSFDKQTEINYNVNRHKLSNIGRSMSILPQLGRAPSVPTMPERPSGCEVGQGQMWAEIAGGVMKGITTGAGIAAKTRDPGLNFNRSSEMGQRAFSNPLKFSSNQAFGTDASLVGPQFGTGGFEF